MESTTQTQAPPLQLHVVRLERGGPWDWSRGLREQDGWDEHARFMNGLVDDGFIVLGGPLAGDRETLHVVVAQSEQEIRERFAQDNWAQNGMLTVKNIESWTILLAPDELERGIVEGRNA
jgi:uncharacterized protein YciI